MTPDYPGPTQPGAPLTARLQFLWLNPGEEVELS